MNQLFEWAPPAFIPPEPWAAFVAMRNRGGRKKDWTDVARDRAVKKLQGMHERGTDLSEVLMTCAEFGWVGVEWGEVSRCWRAKARPVVWLPPSAAPSV